MPTLSHVGPYRVAIRTNDHSPPHVHAKGPDGEARIEPGGTPTDMVIVYNLGIPKRKLVGIIAEIARQHATCRRRWKAIHGH